MDSFENRLKQSDPLATERPLSAAEIAALHDRVLEAARERGPRPGDAWKRRHVGVAALALAVVALALNWERSHAPRQLSDREAALAAVTAPTEVRFTTADGVQVIWLFKTAVD